MLAFTNTYKTIKAVLTISLKTNLVVFYYKN